MEPPSHFLSSSSPLPPRNPNPAQTPPAADLPTAISVLSDLTAVAESTLKSVTDFLCSATPNAGFICCPYDRSHRMPPEVLFRHSLLCPAAPGAPLLDLGFLDDLRYPNSLKSESELREENPFVQPLPAQDADLCFSLDSQLGDLVSNFFYKDCPGVVTTPEPDVSATTFSLPGILSSECANFFCDRDVESRGLGEGGIRILPSEYLAMRCEVEAWNDFPASHSYTALRVMSNLTSDEQGELKRWVISSSPKFGIVIDASMREHIFLLLKLCLKAIGREARSSLKLLVHRNGLVDPKATFGCPILIRSLTWLTSQMAVLYGEVNAKLLTIGMLKESLLHVGSGSLLSRLGAKIEKDGSLNVNDTRANNVICEPNVYNSFGDLKLGKLSENLSGGKIFVSQVAAAVAALHEKSSLEERIKSLRFAQPLSKDQLLLAHSYATARGCEEREQRQNYRPVIEHDGLPLSRADNQELGKSKTREELLAEERDYKRRRISYRGKKVKRNPTEVLRDIIEEHMEDIKKAGGMGYIGKHAADLDADVLPGKHDSQNVAISDLCNSQSADFDLPDTKRNAYRESLHASEGHTSNKKSHLKSRYKQHDSHWEERDRYTYERHKNYDSYSSPAHRSSATSYDQNTHEKEYVDAVSEGTEYNRSDSGYLSRSRDHRSRLTSTSKSYKKEQNYVSRERGKERGKATKTPRIEPVMQDAFEDRYNPSVSYDEYDSTYANVDAVSSHCSSDKLYNSRDNDKYHNEQRRYSSSSRRHSKDH